MKYGSGSEKQAPDFIGQAETTEIVLILKLTERSDFHITVSNSEILNS
jgi:hypothetical protein